MGRVGGGVEGHGYSTISVTAIRLHAVRRHELREHFRALQMSFFFPPFSSPVFEPDADAGFGERTPLCDVFTHRHVRVPVAHETLFQFLQLRHCEVCAFASNTMIDTRAMGRRFLSPNDLGF